MKESDSVASRVYTRQGFTREPLSPLRVLHLGCGARKVPEATGVDMLTLPGVDVVHNLDVTPWPLKDSDFDVIIAHAVLEHVGSFIAVMEEIHRVGRPGARVLICVPYLRSVDAYTDPTHRHFFTSSSLDYVCAEKGGLAAYRYSERLFHRIGFWYSWPQESRNPAVRWFKRLVHKHPRFYDQYLSLLLPVSILLWELEITK